MINESYTESHYCVLVISVLWRWVCILLDAYDFLLVKISHGFFNITSGKTIIHSTCLYLNSGVWQFVQTNAQGPVVCISSQLHVQQLHFGRLKLAMVGMFMSWKSADAVYQGVLFSTDEVVVHLPVYHWIWLSIHYNLYSSTFMSACI